MIARGLLLFAAVLSALHGRDLFGGELVVEPATVKLADTSARRQLLVTFGDRDATLRAKVESSNTAIVDVLDHGYLVPKADGTATVTVTLDGVSKTVPVEVTGLASARQVDFRNEIEPLLT